MALQAVMSVELCAQFEPSEMLMEDYGNGVFEIHSKEVESVKF